MPRRGPANVFDSIQPLVPGRPEPSPEELTAEEAVVWRSIAARLPAGSLGPGFVLLVELCRHKVYASMLARQIVAVRATMDDAVTDALTDTDKAKAVLAGRKELRILMHAHAEQTAALSSLATRLRLTPQSRYQPSTANARAKDGASDARKPWDTSDVTTDRRQ
jgi:hypothetical protein